MCLASVARLRGRAFSWLAGQDPADLDRGGESSAHVDGLGAPYLGTTVPSFRIDQ